MPTDYQLSLQDYLAIARRWAVAGGLTFLLVLAACVVAALVLPRVYQSTATLLVEPPQISGDVVRTPTAPGNAEQRIQAIGQRIMTRENLLRLAAEHQVFDASTGREWKETDVVNAMRSSITIQARVGNMPSWERPSNNVAFDVSFQHGTPEKALELTNALVQLLLESSTRDRVEQASRTNNFLTQEAERVKAQLEGLERRIENYKRTRGDSSAGDHAVMLTQIQSVESDLRAAEREHRQALDELQTLEVELAGARSGVMLPGSVAATGPSSAEQELERAHAELARLRGTYTEDHPDVRRQQRQIEGLTRSLRSESATPAREAAQAQARLAVSRLEARVATTRARAGLLAEQQRSLRSTIGQLRTQLSRAPQIERDLAALQRDYDAARTQYDELRAKQMSAQIVENLEGEQQGERFSLLEPALMPEYPIKPARKKIVALGVFLAIAAGVGVMVLLEMLFARVRGVNAVTAITGQRPMVVIPYIETRHEAAEALALRKRVIALAVGLLILSLAAVHFLITPLHVPLISLLAGPNWN